MKIHGLQKMTLLDFPGKVACTVFLGGCDFRCQYCHNFELVDGSAAPIMDEEELFSFLEKRKGILDGVCVTGGEPCLREDLHDFIRKIKSLGFQVKLDTNGNHPDMVKELVDAGLLDYVAMDIKNCPEKYAMTVGVSQDRLNYSSEHEIDQMHGNSMIQNPSYLSNNIDPEFGMLEKEFSLKSIRQTVSLLLESPINYEFRTTVVEEYHTEEDFQKIGQWISGAKKYFLQQYTPRDTVPDGTLTSPSRETMEKYLSVVKEYVPTAEIRGV